MADQGGVWLVDRRPVCGRRLSQRPIGPTPALSLTLTVPLPQFRHPCTCPKNTQWSFWVNPPIKPTKKVKKPISK